MTFSEKPADIMKRRRTVADALREESLMKFNISTWGEKNSCGTSACIAGYAVAIFDNEMWLNFLRDGTAVMDIENKAAEILGLTEEEADGLFLNIGPLAQTIWTSRIYYDNEITSDLAANTLMAMPRPDKE